MTPIQTLTYAISVLNIMLNANPNNPVAYNHAILLGAQAIQMLRNLLTTLR